jgi:hypothetical protein
MIHTYDLKITQAGDPKWIQLRSVSKMEQAEILDLALQSCFSDINDDYDGLEVWGDHLFLCRPSPADVFELRTGRRKWQKWGWSPPTSVEDAAALNNHRFTIID